MNNGVKNQIGGARFQLTPGGYLTIGAILGFFGLVVGAGGEHAEAGFALLLVAVVPVIIGVIALGIRASR